MSWTWCQVLERCSCKQVGWEAHLLMNLTIQWAETKNNEANLIMIIAPEGNNQQVVQETPAG